MHQAHTIPWNSFASNFKFIRDNPHRTPRVTGLFPRNLPTQGRDLNHFSRVLAETIRTFSETERKKYGKSFKIPPSGLIFSDALRDKYPQHLNEDYQRYDYWIACAEHGDPTSMPYYDAPSEPSFADVVKILINENEISALFTLAHHPRIPFCRLYNVYWGHHFGFSRVGEAALQSYIFFNLVAATNTLLGGEYTEMENYPYFVNEIAGRMHCSAQQLLHRAFLDPKKKNDLPEVHHDLVGLREYLKTAFSLLYRLDMIVRECGRGDDLDWEHEIIKSFSYNRLVAAKVTVEDTWVEGSDGGHYEYQFA